MQIDAGAKCNVLSKDKLASLKLHTAIQRSNVKLKSYSGHTLMPVGQVYLPCTFKEETFSVLFLVINTKAPTILGAETSKKAGLIQKMFSIDDT